MSRGLPAAPHTAIDPIVLSCVGVACHKKRAGRYVRTAAKPVCRRHPVSWRSCPVCFCNGKGFTIRYNFYLRYWRYGFRSKTRRVGFLAGTGVKNSVMTHSGMPACPHTKQCFW